MTSCRVFADYRMMPWKNGLGNSVEVAIMPPGCDFTMTPFVWRISIAQISASTTFSLFHAYDRIIVRLEGDEDVKLKHNLAAQITTIPSFTPYSFRGEWHTEYLLTSGSQVTDMYIIYQRDKVEADVRTVEISAGCSHTYKVSAIGSTLVYPYNGPIEIAFESQKVHQKYSISYGETFELDTVEDDQHICLHLTSSATTKIVIINLKPKLEAELIDPAASYDSSAMWKVWNVPEEEEEPVPRNRGGSFISSPLARSRTRTNSRLLKRSDSILHEHGGPAQVYKPPTFRTRFESEVPPPVIKDSLCLDDFPKGEVGSAWINMVRSPLGEWIRVPVLVARGLEDGPVLGLTAAVHGNELNGVPCIHRIISTIDVHKLKGTVIGVPCVNIVGYLRMQRGWSDGVDLNRRFPGKKKGMASEVFCHALMERIVRPNLHYLIDLHTASFGRINSYYIRADMNDPDTRAMALLQQPQIILHDAGQDGTLRGAATALGIKAITVEVGNPQLLQHQFVQWTTRGILNVLAHYSMFPKEQEDDKCIQPVICSKGHWVYTTNGGLLEVYPGVNTLIKKGDLIARMRNIFGNYVEEYFAETDGIVIGRSSNPVASTGDRILHMGLIHDPSQPLPKAEHEYY